MWKYLGHVDLPSVTSSPFVARKNGLDEIFDQNRDLENSWRKDHDTLFTFPHWGSHGDENGLGGFFASLVNIPFEIMNLNVCAMMFTKCYIVVDKKYLYGSKIIWNFTRNTQIASKSSHFTVPLEWRFSSVDWFWNTPCWNRDQSTLFCLRHVMTVTNLSKTA